jgi:hypothetical protein
MEWNGMKWNEMEWNGMKWNEMEWNGMQLASSLVKAFNTAKSRAKYENS